ncbi:hypothetical protein MmiHf6_15800 [Methanimicrococcus hongohii]|uniref:GLUG domain-containing protein n=1 Tax=Methanimicrococcus hongohii TaxID=3028295 RepID=A0AA96V1R3_9EURY|nr:GLUG motif-containing protein [Methanimicrococcus sp. Hf6]WNY24250.1 hypothetical protein MmiHf6_15800 [Methanimicrococcus sp. Hf6]
MIFKKQGLVLILLVAAMLLTGVAAADDFGPADELSGIEINQSNYQTILPNIGILNEYPLNGYYVLTENITISETSETSETEWTPIGSYGNEFTGTFDGQNYTIIFENDVIFKRDSESDSDLDSDSDSDSKIHKKDGYGLFGNAKSAVFKNLNLVVHNMTVEYLKTAETVDESLYGGDSETAFRPAFGSLVGQMQGTDENRGQIINCRVVGASDNAGAAISGYSHVGGLVGVSSYSDFENSSSSVNVKSDTFYAGGLVSMINGGSLERCYATGNVTADTIAGGFAGVIYNGAFSECFSVGNVTANKTIAGGLIGLISIPATSSDLIPKVSVQNSYTTSIVKAEDIAGGFVGKVLIDNDAADAGATVIFSDNYAAGNVNSDGSVKGGFAGIAESSDDSKWEIDNSNLYDILAENGYGTYVPATEMREKQTFIGNDWELFDMVWFVNEGYDTPRFAWQIFVTYAPGMAFEDAENMPEPLIFVTNGPGTVFEIINTDPVWKEITFLGWLDGFSDDETVYLAGEELIVGSNVTLFATWDIGFDVPDGSIIDIGSDLKSDSSSGTGSAKIIDKIFSNDNSNEGSGIMNTFILDLDGPAGNLIRSAMSLGIFAVLGMLIFTVYYGYRQVKKEE